MEKGTPLSNSISLLMLLTATGGFVYYGLGHIPAFRQTLAQFDLVAPCALPIEYSVGTLDKKFGISEADFKKVIDNAAASWEAPIGKKLFTLVPTGGMTVNLIYDERQRETQVLNKLNLNISNTKESFNSIDQQYKGYLDTYTTKKASYDAALGAFTTKQNAFEEKVQYWNKRGGAPEGTYQELSAERTSLSRDIDALNSTRAELNSLTETINGLAQVLNKLAGDLNLNVHQYNTSAPLLREEFQEGVYESNWRGQKIEIYQFDDKAKLKSVLTHELGHALGLDHVDDKDSIMYRLNEGGDSGQKVTAENIANLKATCKI